MGTAASVESGETGGNAKSGGGGLLGGLMAGASALASAAATAGSEALEAANEALDSSYVVEGQPVRGINSLECKYFNQMNTISRITYIDPSSDGSVSTLQNMGTYLDANGFGYAKNTIKIYEIDSTRAVTGEFELYHKSWEGTKKCFIVAFRGTKTQDAQGKWMMQDVIHDLASTFLSEFKDSNDVTIGSAGMGFVTAYNKLRKASTAPCNAMLDDIIKGAASCPGGLVVTGHSLGGALATLCAVDILKSKQITPKLITFGAPRAFKPNLSRHVDSLTDFENCRIINHGDPIPLLPPSIAGIYRHCGNAYFFKVPQPVKTDEEKAEEEENNALYKDNHDELLAIGLAAKVSGWMAASADKSSGEWFQMDHNDFHGEFPDVMKALMEEIQHDAANMSSILTRVLLEIDICCHDLVGYGQHLVGYMDRALKNK